MNLCVQVTGARKALYMASTGVNYCVFALLAIRTYNRHNILNTCPSYLISYFSLKMKVINMSMTAKKLKIRFIVCPEHKFIIRKV